MMDPLVYISSADYATYSRQVARILGVHSAALISELISHFLYCRNNYKLVSDPDYGDGLFYQTTKQLVDRTCLTRREIDTALQHLCELKVLEYFVFGLPPKRFFRLFPDKLIELLSCNKPQHSESGDPLRLHRRPRQNTKNHSHTGLNQKHKSATIAQNIHPPTTHVRGCDMQKTPSHPHINHKHESATINPHIRRNVMAESCSIPLGAYIQEEQQYRTTEKEKEIKRKSFANPEQRSAIASRRSASASLPLSFSSSRTSEEGERRSCGQHGGIERDEKGRIRRRVSAEDERGDEQERRCLQRGENPKNNQGREQQATSEQLDLFQQPNHVNPPKRGGAGPQTPSSSAESNINPPGRPLKSPTIAQNMSGSVNIAPPPNDELEGALKCEIAKQGKKQQPRDSYGSHVKLRPCEYQQLCDIHGKGCVDAMIERMNDYCLSSKPKGYLDYAAALRNWIRTEKEKSNKFDTKSVKRDIERKQYDRWVAANGEPKFNELRF